MYRSPARHQSPVLRQNLLATQPKKSAVLTNSDYYDYLSRSVSRSLERSQRSQLYSPKSVTQSKFYSPNKSVNLAKSQHEFYTPSRYQQQQQSFVQENLSPMKGNEETHLVQALKQQISINREIDDLKRELALRSDFNLFDAFKVFDKKSRGYLTRFETEQVLNSMQIYPTTE